MERLELIDFLKFKYISGLEASPNKDRLAFLVHEANKENNSYNSNIWVMNRRSGNILQLTSGNEEKSFAWVDDETIIFPSKRDKEIAKKVEIGEKWTSFYSISLNGGEAKKFLDIPATVLDIKKIDSENFLLLVDYENYGIDLHNLKEEEKQEAIKKIKENKDYEILDEIPFWSNGKGFINKKRKRLFIYNLVSKKLYPITDELVDVESFKYKQGTIVYVGNYYSDKKSQQPSLFKYDIKTGLTTTLIEKDQYSMSVLNIVGEDIVIALTDQKSHGINENPDFYILKSGKLELLKKSDVRLANSVGSDCRFGSGKEARAEKDRVYYTATKMHSSNVFWVDTKGNEGVVTELEGSIDCFEIINDTLYFVGMQNMKLQELYEFREGKLRQLTNFNEESLKNKKLSQPEKLDFENDSVKLEGWVIKPTNYKEGEKYPAILDIHGGPKTVYGTVYYHEMQVWANLGYFVFYCNPRGGDGRGNEFADIRGKYGTIDYEDLMKFTDVVLEKYPIIKEKVGVTGGSYGGFMTNWIIGHTNRFACAASQRSISNWISKFGTTDIGYYFNSDQNASTPWENHEKMWWHSPLKYANNVKTPTLFIHSEEDYRCWLAEGLQMFTALKYFGVPARLCMFRGENHELSRSGKPKHRVKRLTEITNWFEYYLK